MIELHPQYIVDEQQNRQSVVIPYEEWSRVLEAMEELEEIEAYDRAKASDDELLPFEEAVAEIEGGRLE